jgi:hypothetical protein
MSTRLIENVVQDFQFKWSFNIILMALLIMVVYNNRKMINRMKPVVDDVQNLNAVEPMSNPYATRLPTIVDSGLTNTNALNWGNDVNNTVCPTKSQAESYLAKSGNDYYSDADYQQAFLGHTEAPVFYDMGDVRKTRDTRNRNKGAVLSSQNQVSYIPALDINGNQVFDVNGMPKWQVCPTGMINVNNTCQPNSEGMEGGWGSDTRSRAIDSFVSDEDLLKY